MKSESEILKLFKAPHELHETLAKRVANDLSDTIKTKGYASLMLSGGSTPRPFLERLSQERLDWAKVRVGLADERWIDPVNDASNEKMVRAALLRDHAAEAAFVKIYRDGMGAEAACGSIANEIQEKLMPFTVVVLGMGLDGHTASLFPRHPKLAEALDPAGNAVCITLEPQSAPYVRISLTLSALLSAKHCYVHIEGAEKLAVLREALAGDDMQQMPIRALLGCDNFAVQVYCSKEV